MFHKIPFLDSSQPYRPHIAKNVHVSPLIQILIHTPHHPLPHPQILVLKNCNLPPSLLEKLIPHPTCAFSSVCSRVCNRAFIRSLCSFSTNGRNHLRSIPIFAWSPAKPKIKFYDPRSYLALPLYRVDLIPGFRCIHNFISASIS